MTKIKKVLQIFGWRCQDGIYITLLSLNVGKWFSNCPLEPFTQAEHAEKTQNSEFRNFDFIIKTTLPLISSMTVGK